MILTEKWLKTDLLVTLNTLITLEKMEHLIKTDFYKIGKYYYYFGEYGELYRQSIVNYNGKTYYANWYGVVNIKDEEVTP